MTLCNKDLCERLFFSTDTDKTVHYSSVMIYALILVPANGWPSEKRAKFEYI